MAEALVAAFATSAGTAAAAAAGSATTATVVTAGASGAATLSSIGSLLSVGATGLSVLGQIQSGQQQASVYKAQAKQSELAARQEELRGREQADNIRRSLQANLASQNAIFAARGIKLTSGTPVTLAQESRREAARDIETTKFSAGQSADALRSEASQSRISARSARTSGYTSAAKTLYSSRDMLGSLLR